MSKTTAKKPSIKPAAHPTAAGRLIGYARVSTTGQDLAAQLDQLKAAGCQIIHREKRSGVQMLDRRELMKMLKAIEPGDIITVTRIDRLARSIFDLFSIVKLIANRQGKFRSLAEPWADTGTPTGRLMLAVLGGLAEVEAGLIRTRTTEGRARAKAEGRHMGRKPILTPTQQAEAIRRRQEGATLKELAESFNVAISTIAKTVKKNNK
jgi:DNA invertase Pin-like site-specific DNA recombinase